MSETYRAFGSKFKLPAASGEWKFSYRPGGWIIAQNGTRRVRLQAWEAKGKFALQLAGRSWYGEVTQTIRGAGAAGGTDADLTAQFPGKVRKILVPPGAIVEAGQGLLLMEAMKMEFTVKAPTAGVVEKIRVTEGQQVSPGDRFVDFRETTAEAPAAARAGKDVPARDRKP